MEMYPNALRQLSEITSLQVKDLFKKLYPIKYEKLIINDDFKVKRTDYYYSELSYLVANRKISMLRFPLYNNLKNDFNLFEGGSAILDGKSIINNSDIILKFEQSKGSIKSNISLVKIPDAYEFPFEIQGDEIGFKQRPYFLSKYTYQKQCKRCDGHKYVVCDNPECQGKHIWDCPDCHNGKVSCEECKGHGYITCGSKFFSSGCNGTGIVTKNVHENGKVHTKTERCLVCKGKGEVPCSNCGTIGLVKCSHCKGYGKITCDQCYGDNHKYGMIDCPECLATGIVSQFVYVETDINVSKTDSLFIKGEKLEINKDKILHHVLKDQQKILVYNNLNGKIYENTDKISNTLLLKYENELTLTKKSYPLLVEEKLKYQIIPCVQFSVKHILTNTEHEVVIIDFWDNPEVIFLTDPEIIKTDIGSVAKSTIGLFSKILKTKGHKNKEDKKTEIKLLIYVAKADGKIQDEEKIFFTENISNLDDFTNSEKKQLFDLLNADVLPDLTEKDIKISDSSRGKEILELLIQLANADGIFALTEKKLIDKVNQILQNQSH